jgi:tetratricopeptide (TPR) repeat protein
MLLFLEGLVGWAGKEPEELDQLLQNLKKAAGKRRPGRPTETNRFLAGALLAAQGKPGRAHRKLREGYDRREDGAFAPVFLVSIARTARAAGDLERAAQACEEVLRPPALSQYRAAALPPCLGILAQVRKKQGRHDEARKHAQALVALWGTSSAEFPELGEARLIAGEK